MAKIKVGEMVIEITYSPGGSLTAYLKNTDQFSHVTVNNMNKSLETLVDMYKPAPGEFVLSITNAIAKWLVDGFGEDAEVVEYDSVNDEPGWIY